MATKLKPIAHEDRLSIVEHLDELRTRIIICVLSFVVVGGICLWQDDRILEIVNQPLVEAQSGKPCDQTRDPLEQADCWQQAQKKLNLQIARTAKALAATDGTEPALRSQLSQLAAEAAASAEATPRGSPRRPVTLGVGEPLTVAGYAALLITLPLLLYQLYAFVLPAFSPREREVAVPLMFLVPFLFYAGVIFA